MKLTEIKKRADENRAKEEARIQHEKLLRDLDRHPLLNWGCGREVREAYFLGIAFAALTDDQKIDELELKCIRRIGCSLSLSDAEQKELLSTVVNSVERAIEAGGDGVFAVLEDCADALKDERVLLLFVAEYTKVCGVKDFDADDVKGQLADHVFSKIDVAFPEDKFDLLCRLVRNKLNVNVYDLRTLVRSLGEEVLRYLMLDVVGDDIADIFKRRLEVHPRVRSGDEYQSLEDYYAAQADSGSFNADCYDYSDVLEER